MGGIVRGMFDCTEKVPGLNLHRKMPHPSLPTAGDDDQPKALQHGWDVIAFCLASAEIYFLYGVICGDKTLMQGSIMRARHQLFQHQCYSDPLTSE